MKPRGYLPRSGRRFKVFSMFFFCRIALRLYIFRRDGGGRTAFDFILSSLQKEKKKLFREGAVVVLCPEGTDDRGGWSCLRNTRTHKDCSTVKRSTERKRRLFGLKVIVLYLAATDHFSHSRSMIHDDEFFFYSLSLLRCHFITC